MKERKGVIQRLIKEISFDLFSFFFISFAKTEPLNKELGTSNISD